MNCISSNATVRVGLTSCRNAFTMVCSLCFYFQGIPNVKIKSISLKISYQQVANLCLYGIAYFVFGAFPSKGPDDVEKQVFPNW